MLSPEKEKMIVRRVSLLRYIPFIRLAVLSGSCATGEANGGSDIDLIIGAENGRVYLCRAFTLLFCDLLGVRNKPPADAEGIQMPALSESNKLCFSHFAGMSDLKMNEPENTYEERSYPHLFPVYGRRSACAAFLQNNAHIIEKFPDYRQSPLYVDKPGRFSASLVEKVLSGKLGDFLEAQAYDLEVKKIWKYAATLSGKTRVITRPNRIETYYDIF